MLDNLLLVVKVGTNVLTSDMGLLDQQILSNLVSQIIKLRNLGHEIILVSSGAVAAGRTAIQPGTKKKVENRQVLASVGQTILITKYQDLFSKSDVVVGQVLATKEDFRDRHHYLNMRNCLKALLKEGVVPIINENDVIAIEELMFTDNDELASLVASMIGANKLMILSDVDGVMDKSPSDPTAKVIPQIDPSLTKKTPNFIGRGSAFGRGGMGTKYRISCRLALMGVDVHIANGKHSTVLLDLINGESIGTHFQRKEKVSPLKKWIAYQENGQQPIIVVNEGASAVLRSDQASSLLPIGIISIDGEFKKGDVASIRDEQGNQIGIGLTQYGSETARNCLGKKGAKPLIHYDYLFTTWKN